MFSRIPTLIFFLLANIIVLTNITIPHHHHKSEISIIDYHCQTDSEIHKHESDSHNHDHDGSSNSEYCVLNQVYIIPYNQLTQEHRDLVNINYHSQFEGFQSVSIDNGSSVKFPVTTLNGQFLVLSFTHTSAVAASIGLRAPPVV